MCYHLKNWSSHVLLSNSFGNQTRLLSLQEWSPSFIPSSFLLLSSWVSSSLWFLTQNKQHFSVVPSIGMQTNLPFAVCFQGCLFLSSSVLLCHWVFIWPPFWIFISAAFWIWKTFWVHFQLRRRRGFHPPLHSIHLSTPWKRYPQDRFTL